MSNRSTLATDDRFLVLSDWERALFEGQLAMLGRLAQDAMAVATGVKDQVIAAPDAPAARTTLFLDRASRTFARAARTVRLTVVLQHRLLKALNTGPTAVRAALLAQPPILTLADDADFREGPERLDREAERLDREDFGDMLHRPVGEVVAKCRAALRLPPDEAAPDEADARKHTPEPMSTTLEDLAAERLRARISAFRAYLAHAANAGISPPPPQPPPDG